MYTSIAGALIGCWGYVYVTGNNIELNIGITIGLFIGIAIAKLND